MSCWLQVITLDILTLVVDTVDEAIDYPLAQQGSAWAGIPGDVYGEFIVMWSGFVYVDVAGDYEFKVTHRDGARVWVNHALLIDHWGCFDEVVEQAGAVSFDTVGYAFLDVMFLSSGKDFGIELAWKKPFATAFESVPAAHFGLRPARLLLLCLAHRAVLPRRRPILPNRPVFFGVPSAGLLLRRAPAPPPRDWRCSPRARSPAHRRRRRRR